MLDHSNKYETKRDVQFVLILLRENGLKNSKIIHKGFKNHIVHLCINTIIATK